MSVRKLIVKTFIREVISDNDSVTITYNFCEDYIQKILRHRRRIIPHRVSLLFHRFRGGVEKDCKGNERIQQRFTLAMFPQADDT